MQQLRAFCSLVVSFGFVISLTACGGAGSDAPSLGQVTGKITMDGAPLADASVTFMPEKVRASAATTDSEGNYELIYIREEKGAAIGKHKVTVSKLKDEKEVIPEKYSGGETELTADVKAGANEFNFDLTSK
ncbi:MAG: carboxypeptidase-like regulatory domain-containing protein [Gimesia sp.]|nr:carboxypeptidase-like regulatory domain-containing protein [Gimesia sp.]